MICVYFYFFDFFCLWVYDFINYNKVEIDMLSGDLGDMIRKLDI